ncbi:MULTISPECIES: cytochrome b/b6 domain-containing protein [Cupriavidus]|nr:MULTISPECIES: cytochrome b/b6 domain-containing protein [Cupriavidus]
MKKPSMPAGTQATVRVWDAVVRFTHWSVAALVLWELVENSGGPLHRTLGYATAGLVLLRLLWGFVGSPPARFSAWLPSPSGALAYSRALLAGRAPRYLSHTPLGALMMVTMWTLILALAATGWLSRLDAFWGEDWPVDLHAALADCLMVLVGVHVVAAIVMGRMHGENLVAAMIHGRKRADDGSSRTTPRG